MKPVLDWSHAALGIGEEPLRVHRSASEAERAALAAALDILACEAIEADYEIRALSGGGYLLQGTIDAVVSQSCVVTLEPVAQRLRENFEAEFWPPSQIPQVPTEEVDAVSGPDREPLEAERIPVGRIVYEQIAAALDPYPRKEGATFSWAQEPGDAERDVSPFAVLKKLKQAP